MWGRSDLDRRESELENWDRVGAEDREVAVKVWQD